MKKLSLILVIFFSIISCKKDNATTSSGPPGPNSTIHPSNDTAFYGFFTFSKWQNLSLNTTPSLSTNYSANAYFTSTPQVYVHNTVIIGGVWLNNLALTCNPNNSFYSISVFHDSACVWQVLGQGVIPSFKYTSNNIKPQYTNYNLLPDTIDHTQNITLYFNIINADNLEIYISDSLHTVNHYIPVGVTSYTFPATLLAALSSGTGSIRIASTNLDIENVYGKPMRFMFEYNFQKIIYIK